MTKTLSLSYQQHLFDEIAATAPMPWEQAAAEDRLTASVVVNRPLQSAYSYLIPEHLRGELQPGQRVRVPFGKGNRLLTGYCVEIGPVADACTRLKWVHSVVDREPLVSSTMLKLTRWIAEQYLCGWGQVLDGVIPQSIKRRAGTRLVKRYRAVSDLADRCSQLKLSAKQQAVLGVLMQTDQALRLEELTTAAACGAAPVQALHGKGLIEVVRERSEVSEPEIAPFLRDDDLQLNRHQERALEGILRALRAQAHQTYLLHGVTGSGKTEVYIQAIREVVSYGRQAIVLVPEISLTPQAIQRFRRRFDSVAVLHSQLTDAERAWYWQQIRQGRVQVVVGARSAVFAPTPHLGLIVIDEEHETSFKQDATPRYHAREVARERARLEGIPLVLGSATPSLESWFRAKTRQDVLLTLPTRVEERPLPPVIVVDTRHDPQRARGEALGRTLESTMRRNLSAGGQVILFLNLRGYSPTLWCRDCGLAVKCPHCDVTLTWHQDRQISLCHTCEYQTVVAKCPHCADASLRYLGHGTQRLEQEVRRKFPQARSLRMDSDSMRRYGSYDAALEAFRTGEVEILLGTQMIAKGLDFPNVTLVGVIDGDTSLHQPDFRAAERTFQLISQVAGRTGRGPRQGRVLVQTTSPEEPAILLAAEHNYEGFAELQLAQRQETLAPPFRRLARVIVRGREEPAVKHQAEEMAAICRDATAALLADVETLGPAPAPIGKLKDWYRYHFHLAAPNVSAIHALWRDVADLFPKPKDVECTIDVDPVNLK